MTEDIHIINKQVFEFECEESEHAFQIQQKTGHEVQYKISRVIDRVCNQLAADDENLQIPLLEINLGKISFNQLEEDIVPAFEKAFYEKLSEWKNRNTSGRPARISKKETSLKILTAFLLTGSLPWYAGKQDKNYITDLFAGIFSGSPEELKRFIIVNLNNKEFIERLIWQPDNSDDDFIISLLNIDPAVVHGMEKELKKSLEEILLLIKDQVDHLSSGKEVILQFEKESLKFKKAESLLIRFLENKIIARDRLHKIAIEFSLKLISGGNNFLNAESLVDYLRKMIVEKFEIDYPVLKQLPQKISQDQAELFDSVQGETVNFKNNKISLSEEVPGKDETEELAKFYISNAGLVLIANYFPAFFNELQLLEDGNFTSKQSQIKAVFFLHYLCTGEESAPEYTLSLNKILCGLPLDEPLPYFVALNDKEKNECKELLNEIINNWQKLGNSSVEGLREAFLNRDGILSFETNGWKLQVERKGFDILLDSLPWTYKHIQFSWMENLITTEW